MAITGKTGADAIHKTLKRQVIVYGKYHGKLSATISTMQTGGLLTGTEASQAQAYINAIASNEAIFKKIADYSGF